MSSFSLEFPDEAIFEVLGDDIEIIEKSTGDTIATIKGEFKSEHQEKEYGEHIDLVYDVVEVMKRDLHYFNVRLNNVGFNGKTYSILKTIPIDSMNDLVVLDSVQ